MSCLQLTVILCLTSKHNCEMMTEMGMTTALQPLVAVRGFTHSLRQCPVQMNCRDTVLAARTDGPGAGQTSTAHGCLSSRKETTQKDWLKKDSKMCWSCNTPWCDYSFLSQQCGCPVLISERLQWYFVALNLLWDGKKHKAVRASSSPANCACRLVAICCPQSNKNLSQKPLTHCSLPHRAFLTPHLSLFHRMCHSWHIAPPCFSWTFKL